ncbi:S1 RNA-binding domain-containing protein [Nocardia sp. NPDC050710]|uniref:S1 RNA-binding domain-containing protein n=1 Tax=Nocardia sp. NPDC050710 TaxID=3157220 RepID=UPI0033FABD3F
MLPYVYRITKYDPADRDEHGAYTGTEGAVSDHGAVEAAYLAAVALFAEETGVRHLSIREPQVTPGFMHFGLEPAIDRHGLAELFPSDLAGFHDGAEVPIGVGVELVRVMLRDGSVWCRLEVEDTFAVHVGWDQYLYVGSRRACAEAVDRTRALGLFPERLDTSPYDIAHDGTDVQRPADDDFWAHLRWAVDTNSAGLLEEHFVGNASRWHRLTRDTVDEVRSRLAPRALLTVWPDLSADVTAALAALHDEDTVEIVWEDEDGRITSVIADDTRFAALAEGISRARAAAVLPLAVDERNPLFTAVLPDGDGIVRARWRTEPTRGDRDWAYLKTLHRGQIVTGTVIEIGPFGVTFVDIGGFIAMINIPELSWRRIDRPADIVTVGQQITAEILGIDMVRERVSLSLRATQDDPLTGFVRQIGRIVTGPVTRIVPFGAFVRIEDRADGFEGLVHTTELTEPSVNRPDDAVHIGDILTVKITDVDIRRRRITLSRIRSATRDSHST